MGIRLNFIVEGQTEEAFVKRILNPHLANLGVYVKVRCVLTSWKNNIKHRGVLRIMRRSRMISMLG